jgi:hypothetical protein
MRLLTFFLFVAAAVLGFYGCWSAWKGFESQNWVGAAFGVAALVAGIAAVLRQPWSRWLVLAVASLFLVSWSYAVWLAVDAGVYGAERPLVIALSLVPGLGMIALGFLCAFILFRFFARSRAQA